MQSVKQLARQQTGSPESSQASAESSSATSLAGLFFGSTADLIGSGWDQEENDDERKRREEEEEVTEETERKFLTLGWWLLNVGWKDVAERVRAAVEEVFSGYVTVSKFVRLWN